MPIFEVEANGQAFEVEAPDMRAAAQALSEHGDFSRNYAASEVPGAALENLPKNAAEVGSGLLEAVTSPLETAKTAGKLAIGMLQGYTPGQQEWEKQYAVPFVKGIVEDYGGWENIKRTVAEKPVQAMLEASIVGAGLPGRAGRIARLANPIEAVGRGATTVAKRAISPFPASEGSAAAARALGQEGVDVTAGQATGSKGLKYAESELGGGATANVIDRQGEQFTRAASRRIGLDTPHLDGNTMEAAYRRIGGEIGAVAARNTMRVDNRLIRDAYNAAGEYNRQVPQTMRVPAVSQILSEITNMRGSLPGDRYQALRSQLGEDARAAARDPHLQRALYGLQRSLDDAMDRSVSGADQAALRNARRQYRNYLVLERAMATGGAETAQGILTPAKLEQALSQVVGKRGYLHGRHDFGPLAKAGKVAMSKMPESGTSFRTASRVVPAVIGGMLGGAGPEGIMGAMAGAAAPSAVGRVMMSRPGQAYLRNQAAAGQTRAGQAVGRAAAPVAAGVSRQESLQQAEAVLSKKVLDHIKQSPATRGLLNEWLKARYAGEGVEQAVQALAEGIAAELQRPDLTPRIMEELTAARQVSAP